jgi:hypothetical protein
LGSETLEEETTELEDNADSLEDDWTPEGCVSGFAADEDSTATGEGTAAAGEDCAGIWLTDESGAVSANESVRSTSTNNKTFFKVQKNISTT